VYVYVHLDLSTGNVESKLFCNPSCVAKLWWVFVKRLFQSQVVFDLHGTFLDGDADLNNCTPSFYGKSLYVSTHHVLSSLCCFVFSTLTMCHKTFYSNSGHHFINHNKIQDNKCIIMSLSRNHHPASRETAQNLQSLLDFYENSGGIDGDSGIDTVYDADDSRRSSTGGSVHDEDNNQSIT